jgi:hypothetical protein
MTLAPSAANRSAIARPMPRADPVTRADCPSKRPDMPFPPKAAQGDIDQFY